MREANHETGGLMHRNVSSVCWLATVLGLALAACGPDSTAPSGGRPAAGQIAFTSDRDGNVDIYLVHADGSGVTRLTNNPARDFWPVWSSDGTKIAFHSERDGNGEIYVVHADGSGLPNLTNNPAWDAAPAWSPDGTKIAFHSERDGNGEIYVMNADGSNPLNLTNNPGWDGFGAWSPDGTKIAFNRERDDGHGERYLVTS